MEIEIKNYHGYTVEPCAFYDSTALSGKRIYTQFEAPEGAIIAYRDFYSGRAFDNPQKSCNEVVVLFEGAGEIKNEPQYWVKPEGAQRIAAHYDIYHGLNNFFFSKLPPEGKPEEWQYSLQLASGINPMGYIKDEGYAYGCKNDNWARRYTHSLPSNELYELEIQRGTNGAEVSDDRIRFRLKK